MYEDDGNKTDEFMGGALFLLYNQGEGFPSTLTVDTGGIVAFELEISYVR